MKAERTISEFIWVAGLMACLTIGSGAGERNRRPDPMVNIGSHRLELRVEGKGTPTVVLETGISDPMDKLRSLQDRLAQVTQVVTYNRAGYGRSEPGPLPRDAGREADELKALLEKASVPGPYVLVGHSLGALIGEIFASKYPDDTAGMVLLDPPPLSFLQGKDYAELGAMAEKMTKEWQASADAAAKSTDAQEQARSPFLRTIASEHGEMFGETARLVDAISTFGDIPLVVVAAGKPNPAFGEAAGEYQKYWIEQSRALSAKSTNGKFVLVKESSHYLYLDVPELVTGSILSVMDEVRARTWGRSRRAAAHVLGLLPAEMSPDSVDFSGSELYVLDRGAVSVFSLPGIVRQRTFGGSGNGPGKLSPRHHFDQALRVIGDRVFAEDNNKLIVFSTAGQFLEEKQKPENSVWFVPVGVGFVAKSMVVSGEPPTQHIRLALYDSQLREIKELYRQEWFQQPAPPGFSTMLLGDLLHFAVVRDKIGIEESPRGFVIELFDAAGNSIRTIRKSIAGIPVTQQDRDHEMILVRKEKRVAAMVGMTGSWEKLQEIWKITFPETTPALRELQPCGDNLLVRTFERRENSAKYLLLNLQGEILKELFLPVGDDAETEARVSGTAFFRLVGERFYYLRQDEGSGRWEVHLHSLSDRQ